MDLCYEVSYLKTLPKKTEASKKLLISLKTINMVSQGGLNIRNNSKFSNKKFNIDKTKSILNKSNSSIRTTTLSKSFEFHDKSSHSFVKNRYSNYLFHPVDDDSSNMKNSLFECETTIDTKSLNQSFFNEKRFSIYENYSEFQINEEIINVNDQNTFPHKIQNYLNGNKSNLVNGYKYDEDSLNLPNSIYYDQMADLSDSLSSDLEEIDYNKRINNFQNLFCEKNKKLTENSITHDKLHSNQNIKIEDQDFCYLDKIQNPIRRNIFNNQKSFYEVIDNKINLLNKEKRESFLNKKDESSLDIKKNKKVLKRIDKTELMQIIYLDRKSKI